MSAMRKRVLVLGGGFAGVYAAQYLEKALGRKGEFEIALILRSRVIRALEEAAVEEHDPQLRRQLLTFVVAGGGFSGVEVAAELNDFVRRVARSYRGLDPQQIRVVLLHSQDRILPEVAP